MAQTQRQQAVGKFYRTEERIKVLLKRDSQVHVMQSGLELQTNQEDTDLRPEVLDTVVAITATTEASPPPVRLQTT